MLRVSKLEERLDRPGVSGLSAGAKAVGVHLILMPPGTRGMPQFIAGRETALYIVSGEIEFWHGPGLISRCTVRAGDVLSLPPGTPHLAVNWGDVMSIAVAAAARTDPADSDNAVVIELPRHLARLLSLPVALQE